MKLNIQHRIIANKKINLTDSEYEIYKNIIDSYSEFGGDMLFQDLFETNEEGIIITVIPPSKRKIPMEVFLFLLSVQQQQVLRKLEDMVIVFLEDARQKHEHTNQGNS